MFDTSCDSRFAWRRWGYGLLAAIVPVVVFLGLTATLSAVAHDDAQPLAPIPPPEGYPKLSLSTKTVTPALTTVGNNTLAYTIEIRNTGATTATDALLVDTLPDGVTYNGDGPFQVVTSQTLIWTGTVGFDATFVVNFSVDVDANFSGTLTNEAVISHPSIARPVTVTAETVVTDEPLLSIEKTSTPAKPGALQPLFYELWVTNWGQPAIDVPLTVSDPLPLNTTLRGIGPDGFTSPISDVVTWTRQVTLDLGQSTRFTFSVDVHDVPSGTVITNEGYAVAAPFAIESGEPYTVTIVDPILMIAKQVWPDPPGSNREMTYTLTVLNVGSLASDLIITDRVPDGVSYVRGGSEAAGVVSWSLDSLATNASQDFTYTVYVSDVMNVPVVNSDYGACATRGACESGTVLTNFVQGPVFETFATIVPIAKKPGGGGVVVTPTLGVRNVGHGNALAATVVLTFYRLSLTDGDVHAYPPAGPSVPLPRGPDCGDKCRTFSWIGDIAHSELVTFSVPGGISTMGGAEGEQYVATIIVTDSLSNMTTPTATSQARGRITHFASVVPLKSARAAIGRGQLLTYTIQVVNYAFTTDEPPILTDTIPLSTTFVRASDGGVSLTISDTVFVSWTLPLLGPGDEVQRTFAVRVDDDLVSGTQIVNHDYAAFGYGNVVTDAVTGGPPVTTTVQEVGLIDSFKVITPRLSLPGPGNVLTCEIHLVNSSAIPLYDVTAYDLLPWADSTYLRDAVASAGEVVSDIVSIDWTGDIGPLSEVVLTASLLVDADFQGVLTNSVTISHPDLLAPVVRHARAYVTEKPVLFVHKTATPDPVGLDELLTYRLRVTNVGQKATVLVITDTLPSNVIYAAGGDALEGETVRWNWPSLGADGQYVEFSLQVTVTGGTEVVNAYYGVRSAEGVAAMGAPLVTPIKGGGTLFLPVIFKQ